MSQPAAPIGVFDSGVGGLTVTRAIVDRLPRESVLYLGDTARVPYGNKSPETIQRYSLRIAARLREGGAKAIVIACNTASAAALERVREEHRDIPVLGVIEPVCRLAVEMSRSGVVGVIGTRSTVRSGAYPQTLRALQPGLQVLQQDCPLFVPLAEEGWLRGLVPREVARTYLSRFVGTGIDTLLLGCTHYPLMRSVIEDSLVELLDEPVQVLDSATATAAALEAVLAESGLLDQRERSPRHHFLVTDDVQSFEATCARFFGAPVTHISHEDL